MFCINELSNIYDHIPFLIHFFPGINYLSPPFSLNLQVFPLSLNSSIKCLSTQFSIWPNLSGNPPSNFPRGIPLGAFLLCPFSIWAGCSLCQLRHATPGFLGLFPLLLSLILVKLPSSTIYLKMVHRR